jgi:hypothetical protein
MSKKRRQHSPDLKAKVGLEAFKGIEPGHAFASRYEVNPVHQRRHLRADWPFLRPEANFLTAKAAAERKLDLQQIHKL